MPHTATRTTHGALGLTHVVGKLDIEWERLRDRAIPVDLSKLLPAAETLGDVDESLPGLPNRTRDAVLHALLSCPAEPIAARRLAQRAVVQMLLGSAIGSLRPGDRAALGTAEAGELAVTCLFEVVATYRLSRTSVWVNLVCDTRRLIARRRADERSVAEHEICVDGLELSPHLGPRDSLGRPGPAGRHASEDMLRMLVWAVRTHVLDAEAAALLARRYRRPDAIVGGRPEAGGFLENAAELAADLELGRAAVRKRCSRAMQKLRAAVADYSLEEIVEIAA